MKDSERAAAKKFSEFWKDKGYEKGESQAFWISLLRDVLGVEHPEAFIVFEEQVHLDHTSFIDGFIPKTKVLIEQKGLGKDLNRPIKQSDGTFLTPFGQAKRYITELPLSRHPRYVVTCNFREFNVYDMERPGGAPEVILLENLEREFYRLEFLVDDGSAHLKREMEVSIAAGKIVGLLYDALLAQYANPESESSLSSLNVLCVRLVFCLYAEDAGIFDRHGMFHDYLESFPANRMRRALIDLFQVLDTKPESRDPYLKEDSPELAAFPYVNGGLFAEENVEIPLFTEEIRTLLLEHASADFDWSEISPTIFGAVFESTLNPETRRKGGMHYTSIENIHKVIDPLFLDSLRDELRAARKIPVERTREKRLKEIQKNLAALSFLDPACGSGNFLTETFISLRRLENEVLRSLSHGQISFGDENSSPIQVSISNFHGIEINDFAVTVAKTALWIAENQMLKETEEIVAMHLDFLPLKTNAFIVEGNALKMDWNAIGGESLPLSPAACASSATPSSGDTPQRPVRYDYIMGNPPFVGARLMSESQKSDVLSVWGNARNIGNADYVSCWYKKAADLIRGTRTKCALVSTNSITQGEQVAIMWKPLFEQGIRIDFAYRTFRWDSESTEKAHVHCVIVGFSDGRSQKLGDRNQKKGDKGRGTREAGNQELGIRNQKKGDKGRGTREEGNQKTGNQKTGSQKTGERNQETEDRKQELGVRRQEAGIKFLIDEKGERRIAKNINGYLLDAPDIFVESRGKPICDVPEIGIGNKPIDGGNYLFTQEEKDAFVKKEPRAEKYFKKWLGSDEFINRYCRWCLWLGDANPAELVKIPLVMERVKAVREFRLASKSAPTRKLAEKPTRFHVENMPKGNSVLIPEVSSEKRKYIPIGFITPDILCSNLVKLIPNASLFHFGILTSSVHMAWTRAVCGRLEMRYRYSKDIVYNNFPWPGAVAQETGNRTQESGDSGHDAGIRNQDKNGGNYGSECGGFDNLAEGDGFDSRNLCADEASAEGGGVFAPGPDEKGFGVDSVEYRGRLRTEQSQGIPQVSADCARLGDGAGNAAENMREDRLSFGEGYGKAARTSGRNQENDVFAHKLQKLSPESCFLSSAEIQRIEATAQAILDARAKYPELSLAELYGENMFMFPELEKAHRENDRAVMQAYGFPPDLSESEIVARLFEMYEKLTQNR